MSSAKLKSEKPFAEKFFLFFKKFFSSKNEKTAILFEKVGKLGKSGKNNIFRKNVTFVIRAGT
ncbi:MAG: hypothetical protein JW787_00435 [Sedimentisphaerales bacterium]|nr:hypothetical protein [Sedimentisphaerales bacterium]